MSYVTTSFFAPLLGLLVPLVVILVVVAVIGVAAGRNASARVAGPQAYFLFGLSLITLAVGVTSAGVAVHAVTELVGPIHQSFPESFGPPPCSATSSGSATSLPAGEDNSGAAATPTTVITDLPSLATNADGEPCIDLGGTSGQTDTDSGGATGSDITILSPTDDSNYYISAAVAAGLFTAVAAGTYVVVWRRARRLAESGRSGRPGVGRLPLNYTYLVAGLAAVVLLVVVPVTVDSIFRAIAPGVNQTSGHAEGVRGTVTFGLLAAILATTLAAHLRFARTVSPAVNRSGDPAEPDHPDESNDPDGPDDER